MTGILLVGGTFDPIHNGHLLVARAGAEKLAVEKVVLIPSGNPPHKNNDLLSAAEDRFAMARLAVEGDALFEVSDCEIKRDGPSYTIDTIRYFHRLYGADRPLYWLIGADSIKELAGWYEAGRLVSECTIVTVRRPGYETDIDPVVFRHVLSEEQIARLREYVLETPQRDVSSTQIRSRIRDGLPVGQMLPQSVYEYICARGLYRASRES